MSAIDAVMRDLRASGRKAFIPFVTAGDPDLELTSEVLRRLDGSGCALCEIGIPYSDPIADGPVIQASYTRALEAGVKLSGIFEACGAVAPSIVAPLVAMVSYSIVYRHGVGRFVDDARAAGFSGAIVPDLLIEESDELVAACRASDFSLIQIVTPTTPRERARRIAAQTTGFVYYVSVTGITGERAELPSELIENLAWLREQTELPICVGFGISRVEHVRAVRAVADGVIVGSAIVRRIAQLDSRPRDEVLDEIESYVKGLIAALES